MATLSGLNATTAQNLQLDAGVLLWGLSLEEDITTLSKGEAQDGGEKFHSLIKSKSLGATKGGTTFTAVPEMRNLLDGVNGSRGNYKDGAVIDTWEISLKTTVSEMTAHNIGYAIANKETNPASDGVYLTHAGTVGRIKKTNYIDNIAWIGTIKGKKAPMIILIKGALNTNGFTFTAADKDSGAVELELKAHFDIANPEDVPFKIYTPQS